MALKSLNLTLELFYLEQILALSAYAKTTADVIERKKKNRYRADFIRTTEAHQQPSQTADMDFTALD